MFFWEITHMWQCNESNYLHYKFPKLTYGIMYSLVSLPFRCVGKYVNSSDTHFIQYWRQHHPTQKTPLFIKKASLSYILNVTSEGKDQIDHSRYQVSFQVYHYHFRGRGYTIYHTSHQKVTNDKGSHAILI